VAFLRDELAGQPEFVVPRPPTGDGTKYHTHTGFFGLHDGWMLQAMLRQARAPDGSAAAGRRCSAHA
jgi:hypothetical protein